MNHFLQLVEQRYPDYDVKPLNGGGTNTLFLLEQRENKSVLKISMGSNQRTSNEIIFLTFLNRLQNVPKLLRELTIDGRVALELEFIPGTPLLECILNGKVLNCIEEIFISLGQSLAQLHNIEIDNHVQLPEVPQKLTSPKSFIDEILFKRSMDQCSMLEKPEIPVLLHGDFGYHNVIRDRHGNNKLIDWEFAGIGDPRVDIGNVLFWTHLHFPENASEFCNKFIKAYSSLRNVELSQDTVHPYIIFQIWRILEIVTDHFPMQVKVEWNRRLGWALEHTFI